jgi:Na+-driven multidrug efflux pump
VRSLATVLICITASIMPFNAYSHASYFTLRAGGQTGVTFLFDSVYIWVCCVSVAFILSRFTTIPIIPMYWIIHIADYLKPLWATLCCVRAPGSEISLSKGAEK